MQICLKCAREESDMKKTVCQCGGTLWLPMYVGAKYGNRDFDEAARLIRKGQKPWEKER